MRLAFPVEYKDVNITEGFNRPCLSVDIGDYTTNYITKTRLSEEVPVMIYYFPVKHKKTYLNLISMREKLKALFHEPIEIEKGFFVFSPEFESHINEEDKTLTVTLYFHLEYEDSYLKTEEFEAISKANQREEDTEEMMEVLHFSY